MEAQLEGGLIIMAQPINFDMNDPMVQEAIKYWQDMQSGNLQGMPTMSTRKWAQGMANAMGNTYGSSYDDSWLRSYLGYDAPGVGADLQNMQMQYGAQRAKNVGDIDTSWLPAAPQSLAGNAYPTIQQRQQAINWANTMGQYNPEAVDEQTIQQYIAGNSPAARNLQQQYAYGLYNRTGEWHPEYVNATPYGGTPTADQKLAAMQWELANRAMQHQAYDYQSGQWRTQSDTLQDLARLLAEQAAQTAQTSSGEGANPAAQAAAMQALSSDDKANTNSVLGRTPTAVSTPQEAKESVWNFLSTGNDVLDRLRAGTLSSILNPYDDDRVPNPANFTEADKTEIINMLTESAKKMPYNDFVVLLGKVKPMIGKDLHDYMYFMAGDWNVKKYWKQGGLQLPNQ